MQKWLLPTLSEVLARSEQIWADEAIGQSKWAHTTETDGHAPSKKDDAGSVSMALQRVKAEQQWQAAIASLEHLLRQVLTTSDPIDKDDHQSSMQGLVLTGPLPVLSGPELNCCFQSWNFTAQLYDALAWMPFQLPPAKNEQISKTLEYPHSLPLLPIDPLAAEQFCVVFTTRFSLVIVLGEDLDGQPAFLFSFDPEVVKQAWALLRLRMMLMQLPQVGQLDTLVEQFAPVAPDYRTVMQFSRLLLKYLPEKEEQKGRGAEGQRCRGAEKQKITEDISNPKSQILNPKSNDVELLQAFAHEVRTPLATIRTLTRLLLRRKDLAPDIIKRLEFIDHECTEQIDRMELLFRAAEIETSEVKSSTVHLTTTSLSQLFQHSLPRWQKQASRRNQTLDVVTPQQMPPVESDPTMLDQILTGLIENFTRNLPAGSHIQMQVTPAGNQLKVQLQHQSEEVEPECGGQEGSPVPDSRKRKAIGQLLMFQPETGSLCLNPNVTKNLFHALGGKLIVRQRPQYGEVMTIYLPVVRGSRS